MHGVWSCWVLMTHDIQSPQLPCLSGRPPLSSPMFACEAAPRRNTAKRCKESVGNMSDTCQFSCGKLGTQYTVVPYFQLALTAC